MNNESILIDFYEFTMAYGYFKNQDHTKKVTFDLFFRKIPDDGGFAIMAGLESIINYIKNLKFTEDDIAYFKKRDIFDDAFLDYLRHFKFTGDVYAMREGSVIFPNEPILIVHAPIIEAQLIETFLLQTINHQSLIATKAARLKHASKERIIIEMGARRAHGSSSANLGARAAYIGGIDSSSNTMADRLYGVPAAGTMAHSWIQTFDHEIDAFRAYARTFPNHTAFLVDTYDTIYSGVPNAIKVIKEELHPRGIKNYSIRIDSGDLNYVSRRARHMLDEAGLPECKIIVSNALDEHLIKSLIDQGSPIDIFGVGERLITSKSDPVFGGVYKLTSIEENGKVIPKIKLSDNPNKVTNPHFKKVYRIYDKETMHANADLITVFDEVINTDKPLTIFDPTHTWRERTFTDYEIKELLLPIFKEGNLVYNLPTLKEIRAYRQQEMDQLWDEMKRFAYPHQYVVDLSEKLWMVKMDLIKKYKENKDY